MTQVDALRTHLYLKEEPLVKRMALVLGWGWSKRRKNEWYSTQIFQKILHSSRLPIRNSSVSWWGPWKQEDHTHRDRHIDTDRCHDIERKNTQIKGRRVHDKSLLQYSHEPPGGA